MVIDLIPFASQNTTPIPLIRHRTNKDLEDLYTAMALPASRRSPSGARSRMLLADYNSLLSGVAMATQYGSSISNHSP